jgi:hypothetical protein
MAYFKVGSLIHCGTNAATWRVTAINPDGSLQVVYVSGKRMPPETVKRIERPEKYSRVEGPALFGAE